MLPSTPARTMRVLHRPSPQTAAGAEAATATASYIVCSRFVDHRLLAHKSSADGAAPRSFARARRVITVSRRGSDDAAAAVYCATEMVYSRLLPQLPNFANIHRSEVVGKVVSPSRKRSVYERRITPRVAPRSGSQRSSTAGAMHRTSPHGRPSAQRGSSVSCRRNNRALIDNDSKPSTVTSPRGSRDCEHGDAHMRYNPPQK
ncbi:hypothetical protein HPB50_024210 [Hyalomma asiaticum]|uniref:Uncharacterized protein n=1 Tax=Hyalomma asiaticum TaxID=266040 RepID=A0ACB7SSN1_HYAAI|nr:hypothetical protein HPB50_024210 [Hyalomma asiaticum]